MLIGIKNCYPQRKAGRASDKPLPEPANKVAGGQRAMSREAPLPNSLVLGYP